MGAITPQPRKNPTLLMTKELKQCGFCRVENEIRRGEGAAPCGGEGKQRFGSKT